jgi:hypothetical protein
MFRALYATFERWSYVPPAAQQRQITATFIAGNIPGFARVLTPPTCRVPRPHFRALSMVDITSSGTSPLPPSRRAPACSPRPLPTAASPFSARATALAPSKTVNESKALDDEARGPVRLGGMDGLVLGVGTARDLVAACARLTRPLRRRSPSLTPAPTRPQIRVYAKRPEDPDYAKVFIDLGEDVAGLKERAVEKLELGVPPNRVTLKLLKLDGTEEALDSAADVGSCLADRARVIVYVAPIAPVASVASAPTDEAFDPPIGASVAVDGCGRRRSSNALLPHRAVGGARRSRFSLTGPSSSLPHPVPSISRPSQMSRIPTGTTT